MYHMIYTAVCWGGPSQGRWSSIYQCSWTGGPCLSGDYTIMFCQCAWLLCAGRGPWGHWTEVLCMESGHSQRWVSEHSLCLLVVLIPTTCLHSWSQLNTDNPLKELQKTFFSALIMEGFTRELDVMSLLPELPCLLTYSTLVSRGVASDPVFQFMLRAGYEQLQRVQASARAGLDQDTGQAMDNS